MSSQGRRAGCQDAAQKNGRASSAFLKAHLRDYGMLLSLVAIMAFSSST